ncbi:hypothetical protein P8452_20272 [Trifolium repens]|nr:hypothetical protein P8452_20272 [Trifolium repens]
MEFLSSIVGTVAEHTVVPIGRQASYLIFYKGNFSMLAVHVKDLEAAKERMTHSVEEEKRNGKNIETDVMNWLEKVNELIEKANQLQSDPGHANAKCSAWPFPNLILRHQLSRKATKIVKDVFEVQEKGKFDRIGYLPNLDGEASFSSTRGGENYETRESLKENIMKALTHHSSCNIGVYGLGGVGKTTLLEEVFEMSKQQKLFDTVVTANVTKNPDIKTIQGEIADLLGLRFDEETILGRARRLRERIMMENNILVVLDDIWTILDLKKVGIPFGSEHNGCKLLMTSRNQDVLFQMDVPKDFTFKLGLMSENETWTLFQFMAGDVVKDSNLKGVAIQVAQKCEGLPLMVVTVARAMKNKRDVQSWKDALRRLESGSHTISSALKLSYDSLESDEMRDVFLLFALFPYEKVHYFLKVAMGLDILKDIKNVDDARNGLYSIIHSLEATCLLEIKTNGNIQMHDFVRDFALFIAHTDKHVFLKKQSDKECPTKDFLTRCTQVVLDNCMHELPQMIDCPNIKFFCLSSGNRSLEIPDNFFEGMGSLRVLDLTSLNLSSLPTSFRFLTSLQTLCLNFCILENMGEINALQNLKILCLWGSSMTKLPREIGQLTQLRMLDLSKSGIEVIPPNILSSLTNLEELYMGNTFVNWENVNSTAQNKNASIAELRKLPNLTTLELQIRELPRDLQTVFEKLERYKIAIGDVWEWPDIVNGTSKTLMLKLGTNIHLEHGIKPLIMGVENLYLDDVDGIQNVVYQLNREGFPSLKHLHIQNNANMKHIVDSQERNQLDVFPILETLVLYNLKNLEHICLGPLSIASFGSLSVIKVKNCVQLKYLFSFTLVKELSRLSEIEVCHCNSMKEIVLGDNNSSASMVFPFHSLTLEHLETLQNFFSRNKQRHQLLDPSVSTPLFNAQVAFPNLETLKLSSLNLNKVWDDSHQSMCNLTSLIVENCGGWKYLFLSSMVGSFKNLKHLEISNCPLMEEIIAKEERNNEIEEVNFLKLEKITLKDMDNLNTTWHRQFETVKMLQVRNCKKIVVVFPSSMQETYNKLEMLEVTDCALVEEIFELSFNENNSSVENATHLKVVLDGLPKLKNIWSGDCHRILSFQILIFVKLKNCASLEYLLPLSIATHCSHLKELHIESCVNMKEIVAEEEETRLSATPTFEFNQLSSLLLLNLIKLNGFYAKKHTVACPSLKDIDVYGCARLNLYTTLSTRNSNFQDNKLPVITQQPPFIVEEVIPNLEKLRINHKEANVILQAQNSSALFTKLTFLGLSKYNIEDVTFPYWFLQNVHTLESLVVEWSCFKKIFQDEGQISEKKTYPQLKSLTLYQLHKLQHICDEGFQIDPVLEFLEYLDVDNCSSLLSLLPSSATLNHLEYLEITNCNGLKKLIASPTAQNLEKLASLKIKNCSSLKEIITGEENVGIAFISLQLLILDCLPSLNKFCSSKCFLKFPLLKTVIVRECPRMKIFSEGNISTPNLRKVKIAENDEWLWKGNLNDTITSIFQDKVAFGSFKHLKLSEYPELKESWYGQPQHNVFMSLKYLVVHKCDFLSEVLFQPNLLEMLMKLEALDIKDCNSLEAIFDLRDEFEKEILVKNSTQLKKLKLSNLPKLKHVWKEGQHNTMGFQNLSEVSVVCCTSLKSLFPLSVARDLKQIQSLEVCESGIEEIVGKEEGLKEIVKFVFPYLTFIKLHHLAKLKAFFGGVHSLQSKSLKTINVLGCPKMELFKAEPLRHQESTRNDKLNISTYQPMFMIEEVLNNVETLDMNIKYFDMILHSQYSGVQFNKVKNIGVSECCNEEVTFPCWFLKNVPNLESILIKWSSFREIFSGEQLISTEKETQIIPRLKELNCWYMDKLQCICKEGLQMDPVLQFLESIDVHQCSSLVKLVPSSVTFNYLTYLEVTNCNGLKDLITYSTAKSLVKLETMKIKMCNWLEDIVNGKEEEEDEMTKIEFCNLKSLELISLPRLCVFSSCPCLILFPLLEDVVVKECPRMEHFSLGVTSTIFLKHIQIDEENHWEGDLNGTVKKLFDDKVAFRKFNRLALADYPELKDLWYGQHNHNVFCNLKSLVVQKCDFLSHVLLPSNVMQTLHGLEDLKVTDCDSLEAVFDVKDMKSREILIKQSSQLKTLTLSSLPKLKHIWNEDPHEIISFGNLCKVEVYNCQSLLYIFPLSLCQDLGHLEMLDIESCGVEEIVEMEEGSMEINFNFPQLNTLRLYLLTNLKNFYQGKHALDCPCLKIFNVYRCEALRMFSFTHLDFQQPNAAGGNPTIPQQALFSIEKLSHNVGELAINCPDAIEILNQENVFHKVKFLRLQCFNETPTIFLNELHSTFPNLEMFQVRNSSFETLFPTEATIGHCNMQISNQIRTLYLYELENLKHIWQEDFPLYHPLPQDLEILSAWNCPSLISLVPSSTSFTNLTFLKVENCKELFYLITSSTAKSLVQLSTLKILNCEKMLDVVKIDEEKAEENIKFENLEYLELSSLPSFRSFCYEKQAFIFPSLLRFIVKGCPQMKIFSSGVTVAPYLTEIEVEEEKMRWKGDLNTTIEQLFIEKVHNCLC